MLRTTLVFFTLALSAASAFAQRLETPAATTPTAAAQASPAKLALRAYQEANYHKRALVTAARISDLQLSLGRSDSSGTRNLLTEALETDRASYEALKPHAKTPEQQRILMEWRVEMQRAYNEAAGGRLTAATDASSDKAGEMLKIAFE